MKAPNSRDRNSVSVSLGHHKKKKTCEASRYGKEHYLKFNSWVLLGSIYSCTFAGIVGIEMVDGHGCQAAVFFFWGGGEKNRQKATLPKISPENPLFS